MNETLLQAIAILAGNVATIRESYRVESGLNYCSSMNAGFDIPAGAKFARVYSTETWQSHDATKPAETRQQIYAFIALEDFSTKELGQVKAGDVMKPASYKKPAKHARGNVFDAEGGLGTANQYGPGYLR